MLLGANHKQLNRHLAAAKSSATYRVMDRVAERVASGANIISLNAGEPDFDTPVHICDAAVKAIRDGHTRYTQVAGLRSLREAVADKFRRENGLECRWQDTIVGAGGKHILYNALAATLNEGDEVIVPAPYWVSYPDIVALLGGRPVIIPCQAEAGFKLTADALKAAITPRTRWLILNSPSNPTGAVYQREDLEALAEVVRSHPQIMILADDIYEHLVFDGATFFTFAQVAPDLAERTLTMNGVSKAYAMTGWRIGFGTGPGWLISAMTKLQGQQTSGACAISQHAALAALTGPQDFIQASREVFQHRRDIVVKTLNAVPGLSCGTPGGAFYAFVSCEGVIGRTGPGGEILESDEAVAMALLEHADVAVVHGSAFGLAPHFRLAYALDEASLSEACHRIATFVSNLR